MEANISHTGTWIPRETWRIPLWKLVNKCGAPLLTQAPMLLLHGAGKFHSNQAGNCQITHSLI